MTDMRGKSVITLVVITAMMSLFLLSCGNKEKEPIYQPPDEERYSGETGGLYNLEGGAPPPDTTTEEEYESPFGPKFPKQIQWAPSLKDAINRAKSDPGKKVLVWFVSRSCDECKEVEQTVFSSQQVLRQSDKYIWYRFDIDTDPEMAKYYIKDHQPPVLKWLDADGNGYFTLYGGFDDPELLAAYLRDKH